MVDFKLGKRKEKKDPLFSLALKIKNFPYIRYNDNMN